jgi:putative flippase GtrA
MILDRIFLKFVLVGLINTLVGTAVMFTLYNIAGCGYWLASASNYFFTSILSFFLNKYFTFRAKSWSAFMVLAFAVTIIASYGLAYGIAKPVTYRILSSHSQKIQGNVSLLAGMCLFTGINYLGQRFVVFRKKSTQEKDGE